MSMPTAGGRAIRLDTDHAVQELMAATVSRINSTIQVELRESRVHLTGSTQSWHEKQLAQESLRSLSDAYVIRNDIQVAAWT